MAEEMAELVSNHSQVVVEVGILEAGNLRNLEVYLRLERSAQQRRVLTGIAAEEDTLLVVEDHHS